MSELLCQSCGLCCDGTLFSSVPLEPGELVWAERLRLPIVVEGGSQSFRQPCACFDGASCVEYADRPSACRTYKCKLFIRLEAGETTLEEASAKVAKAKGLARRTFPKGRAGGPPTGRDEDPMWKLDACELMARLDRDFKTQKPTP